MSTKDDKVGYRRPPKHSQFQKGRSGNPGGRPKGRRGVSDVLASALYEKVTVVENGQRVMLTKLEAAAKQIANKAASGDAKAAKLVIDFLRQVEASEQANQPEGTVDHETQRARDEAILEAVRRRILSCKSGGGDES